MKTLRLYNANGEHILSIAPCGDKDLSGLQIYDLCLANGQVLYHELPEDVVRQFKKVQDKF